MKYVLRITVFAFLLLSFENLSAQDESLTKEYKEQAIQKLSELMNDFYIFPEVAKTTEQHLISQLKSGHFKQFNDTESFATALTESVQHINKDKHMRIWKNRPYEAPEQTPERMIEEQLDRKDRNRKYNAGFTTVKIMEGNVGYLDLRSFAGLGMGRHFADAYMKLIAQTDAVIIDMSKNGGGDPAMVQYLCSFFFKGNVHLNSLYFREGDRTIDFFTLDEVEGEKMLDVPLFVITGKKTFSGAEEFSYNMQTRKRATLIGETTGGGANPGGSRVINSDLTVFIPTGMAINPITKTNWEGVGVIPEIKTTAEEAQSKAHEMAMVAAESYREDSNAKFTKKYNELNASFSSFKKGQSDDIVLNSVKKSLADDILGEAEVNMLGYTYLMNFEKPEVAESIFKANTVLFPNSPNVYDSYAESLMVNGKLELSAENYQKAVDVATKNENGDVEFYQMNLDKVKTMIKEKK
ncbi:MAG: hypothetical protein ACJA1A_000534 [Saprospiraceae bacterium]|jgi:hypothetical protein